MDIERVKETARLGQNPFVAILSCSDSRVPMEKVFDQGIGDIFSVRIAGNVCDTMAIGSMEYAVRYAGTRLCVILGHTRCGAVTAVCSYRKSICESVDMLMRAILPAVRRVENATGKKGKEITDFACKENVFVQIEALFGSSSTLRKAVRKKEIMIIGALYDTETGRVDFMGPHPKNKQLAEEPIGEMQSGNL